jgi:hypothetical protein
MTAHITNLLAEFRYQLLAFRRDQLWLPAGLLVLAAGLILVFGRGRDVSLIGVGVLDAILPLAAGLLASAAVVGDPVLELQLATAWPRWRLLAERLGLLLGITAAAALVFQVFLALAGADMAGSGSLAARQLVWLVPSLVMMGLASLGAFATAQSMVGSVLPGVIWLEQLADRGWLESAWGRYVYLFTAVRRPDSRVLLTNRLCLVGLTGLLLLAAARLFAREERYF